MDFFSKTAGDQSFQSGSRESARLEAVGQDGALLRDMKVEELPGEKIFYEDLECFGTADVFGALNKITAHARKAKQAKPRKIKIPTGSQYLVAQ